MEMLDSFQQKMTEKVQMHRKSQKLQASLLFLKEINVLRLLTHHMLMLNDYLCPACSDALLWLTVWLFLLHQVTEIFQQMKEQMYTVYEKNSAEMQLMLQELAEVLDSCTKLNDELVEAGQALESLREGLGITQSSNL